MHPRAQQLIETLKLSPHPEGGYYREVYRSELLVHSAKVDQPRASITDIYFLLVADQVSRWHRVAHDELWNFYEGDELVIHQLSSDQQSYSHYRLDSQTATYKHLVPAGYWQSAETSGEYTLVGCTVAPGFDFDDFRMMKELPETAERVYADYPDLARFI
ncbi:MAG TPA: cupin domain-containing protein [Geopsychrobacteraceae bacterium]|nr:cupin domain-containing protein [Geopsychrobacteraceae bacterium]